ncbi:MAG: class II glutamine amidotransferase [Rhizobiaceae bacterium]
MCRLLAYCGPSIPLENIVIKPSHSLVIQSQVAEEAKLAVNGDGFGLAWYSGHDQAAQTDIPQSMPALYKEIMPAWANPNLLHICRAVRAGVFLAHVRASTFGGASYQNCHPFTYGCWSFVHNGQIGGFEKLRRVLEQQLPDELFQARLGITDSELIFLLMIANGLESTPHSACQTTVRQIADLHQSMGICQPLRLTFVLTDGVRLYGGRYSSDGNSPTLYLSSKLDHGGVALASEPLDGDHKGWAMVKESTMVRIDGQDQRKFVLAPRRLEAA